MTVSWQNPQNLRIIPDALPRYVRQNHWNNSNGGRLPILSERMNIFDVL
jgi:hypothetical protein